MITIPSSSGTAKDGTVYAVYGDTGPIVVLVHGLGLTRDMWRWQLPALAEDFTVLTYDLTGSGESSPPTETPSLTMFSNQLAHLIDELGMDRVAVAGFSLGGMIARRFAMDHPDRLWALAILNSAHKRDAAAHDAIQKRVYQAQNEGPAATVEAALERWFTSEFRDKNPDVMVFIRDTILANDRNIYPKNYQVLVDGVEELIAPRPPIHCPSLVMTGEEDFGNSVAMTKAIAAEIPGAKTIILPGLRHMAMVEAPDLYNRELVSFLKDAKRGDG